MKYFLLLVFSLVFSYNQETKCQSVDPSFSIWAPRKATPKFIEPGSKMTAEVIAPETISAAGWKVALFTDLGKKWDCKFLSAEYKVNGLDLTAKSGWIITFKVPEFVVPELCALKVTGPDGMNDFRNDAVSVVSAGTLNDSFYGVLFTDEHVFRKAAIKEDGANSMDNIKLSAQVLNIANPRFVACPGDYSTAQSKREEEWMEGNYLTVKNAFKVPTLQSTGNHEYDHWQNVAKTVPLDFTFSDYENYFGQRSCITRLGPVSILTHEINTNQLPLMPDTSLTARVASAWRAELSDTSVKYRVIIQHCFDSSMGAFIPENHGMGANGCNLMLGGHVHKTVISSAPGKGCNYYRLFGAAAERYGRSEWFTFTKDKNNNWSCPQADSSYCDSINTMPLYSNALDKSLNLIAVYDHVNDGTYTGSSNSCHITNKIRFNFSNGRIRFLMPKGKYLVKGGTKLGQYDYEDGNKIKTAVICKVNIPARTNLDGAVTISISSATD